MSKDKPFISVCTIFKNEQRFLSGFLENYRSLADEFVLVDTGSDDSSLQIISDHGLSYHSFPWIGDFGKARTHSLGLATGEWILVADPDDRIRPEDARRLRQLLSSCTDLGVMLPYVNLSDFEWEANNPQVLSVQSRLICFRNHRGVEYRGAIHEDPMPSVEEQNGTLLQADIPVYHLGYAAKLIKEKTQRNMEMINSLYAAGQREPDLVMHWHSLHWKNDLHTLEELQQAFHQSLSSRRARIAETVLLWYSDFDFENPKIQVWVNQVKALKPQSRVLVFHQARLAFARGDQDLALRLYSSLETAASTDLSTRCQPEILYRHAFVLASLGEFQQALAKIEDIMKRFGPLPDSWFLRLKILLALGRNQEAAVMLEDIPSTLISLADSKKAELKKFIAVLAPDKADILQ